MVDIGVKVRELVTYLLDGTDMFLLQVEVDKGYNICVFIDSFSEITIANCISIHRKLQAEMNNDGLFSKLNYSLEVSSPGVDRPLVDLRQYYKHIGRDLSVTNLDGRNYSGRLESVTDSGISLILSGGLVSTEDTVYIDFRDIQISFVVALI